MVNPSERHGGLRAQKPRLWSGVWRETERREESGGKLWSFTSMFDVVSYSVMMEGEGRGFLLI